MLPFQREQLLARESQIAQYDDLHIAPAIAATASKLSHVQENHILLKGYLSQMTLMPPNKGGGPPTLG